MQYFSLLRADFKPKELGSLGEAGCQTLQGCFSVGNEGSIVCKQQLSDKLLQGLCVGLQMPQVEEVAIGTIADVDAVFLVKILHCLLKHHAEEDLGL